MPLAGDQFDVLDGARLVGVRAEPGPQQVAQDVAGLPLTLGEAGDRPNNPGVAISPNGTDVYLVYTAYLQPFQTTTASPRLMQGVALR